MAAKDEKELIPLLMDELTEPERVMLGRMTYDGGYKVLVKLFNAACIRVTQDIVRLDPEKPDYARLLEIRSQRSRNINEFCAMVLKSLDYHVDILRHQKLEEQTQEEDAVAKVFGIHKVPPKAKKIIGQKQEEKSQPVVNESK